MLAALFTAIQGEIVTQSHEFQFDFGRALTAYEDSLTDTAKSPITFNQLEYSMKHHDLTKPFQHIHMQGEKHQGQYGWLKFDSMTFTDAKVGNAQVAAGGGTKNQKVSLVVSNITMKIPPTNFTTRPAGWFTVTCDGVVQGLITGAAAAVEGVVNLAAEGVPVVGELSAMPIDKAIVKIEHKLEGLCAMVEEVLEGLLAFLGNLIKSLLTTAIPNLVQGILTMLVSDIPKLTPGVEGDFLLAPM